MKPAEAVVKYRPFVVALAKKYARVYSVEFEDLLQDGLFAIAKAMKKWRKRGGLNVFSWINGPVRWAMNRRVQEERGKGTKKSRLLKRVPHISMDAQFEPFSDGSMGECQNLHDFIGTFDEPPDYFALERLAAAVAALPQREREIIRMRFASGLTLAQVGRRLGGLSRERIRQIEREALEKLRVAIVAKEKRPS